MGLTKLREIHLAIEASPVDGTLPNRITGTDIVSRTSEISFSIDNKQVERPLSRASLTNAPKLNPGQSLVTLTFTVEMAGHPNNPDKIAGEIFDEPRWGRLLQCSGFRPITTPVFEVPIGAVTGGPFLHREPVTWAGPGGGIVVGAAFNGYPKMYLTTLTGTALAASTVITGSTSGATATVSVGAGTISTPTSVRRGAHELTSNRALASTSGAMDVYFDGNRLTLAGVRGNPAFNWLHAEPGKMTFSMTGVFVEYIEDASPGQAGDAQLKPPLFFNDGADQLSFIFQNAAGTAAYNSADKRALTTLSLDLGATVTARENSLTVGGLDEAIITSRTPVGSFNPDEVLQSEFDFIALLRSGEELNLRLEVGATMGNSYVALAPYCVLSQLADGERDEIHIWDGSFDLTGGDRSDGSVGADNELIIIQG